MAISYVGGSSAVLVTIASTTLTLTLPSGILPGDLVLIYAANGEDSPQPSVTTPPSGYTQRGSGVFLDYGAGGITGTLWYKFAQAGDTNPSITWNTGNSTSGGLWAVIVVYRGVDPTSPFDLASVSEGTNAAATTFTPPSVTTQTDNAWVVSFIQTGDNNANILNSGNEQGFTARLSGSSFQTTTGSDAGFGVADKAIATAGSVTLPTWEQSTVGADAWGYQTIGLTAWTGPLVKSGATNNSGTGTSTGTTVTLPSGLSDGDVAYMAVAMNTATDRGDPSGWTLLDFNSDSSSVLQQKVYRKSLTASESGTAVSWTLSNAQKWSIALVVVSNDGGVDVQGTTIIEETSSTAYRLDSVDPTVAPNLLLGFLGWRVNATGTTTATPPTDWTEYVETSVNASAAPTNATVINFQQTNSTAASTNRTDGTVSAASSDRISLVLAVKPPSPNGTFDTTVGEAIASGGSTSFVGDSTVFFTEDYEGTAGAAMSSSNTNWDLFNGAGTRTLESSPTPIYGSTLGDYSGGQALTKDTTSLPGTTNGGSVQRVLYFRGYFTLENTTSLTLSRMVVFEESVANGGADVGVLRMNADGSFRLMDGTTAVGSASTKTLDTNPVRIELCLDQNNNEITYRLWWGADLHNASTGATNYETQTATLSTNTDMEVFGVGFYASQTTANHLYVEEVAVADNWLGPVAVSSNGTFDTTVGDAPAAGGSTSFAGGATFTTLVGDAPAAGGTTSFTGNATFTTLAADAPAAGGTTSFTGTAVFDTLAASAPADGGVTSFAGGATFDTLAASAPADGGSSTFTGTATFDTLVGTATAAGGVTTFDAGSNGTFDTLAGDAPAAGGSTTFTGGATFDTLAGDAPAAGGSTAFTGSATFDTVVGTATAAGGVTTFDVAGDGTFTTLVGDAPAAGGSSSFTGSATFTTLVGDAPAAGGSTSFAGGATFATLVGDAPAVGGSSAFTGGATFDTLAASAPAAGGSSSFTGSATFTTLVGEAIASGGDTSFTGDNVTWFTEDYEGTPTATMTSSNTNWEIFNGAGSSTLESTPTPMFGSTLGEYNGGQALTKDTTSLPGTVNGGAVQRVLYFRGYFSVDSVTNLTLSRMIVFESSVGTGGTDIGVLRMNANGTFRLMDGLTAVGSASTQAISTTPTRIELKLDQDANEITYRLWWGADLHNPSTGATNYETQTATLSTNTDMEVFGVGFYATQTTNHSLYVEEVAVASGDWIGPASQDATFTTLAASAPAAGGSTSFAGGATFTTLVGTATAAGGVTTFDTSASGTFTTLVGDAIAAGGVTTFSATGSGTFDTLAGEAVAAGGVSTFDTSGGVSTFATIVGVAVASGGVGSFDVTSALYRLVLPQRPARKSRGPSRLGIFLDSVPATYSVVIEDGVARRVTYPSAGLPADTVFLGGHEHLLEAGDPRIAILEAAGFEMVEA